MERGRKNKRILKLPDENGYVMLSTLYLLLLTGVFTQYLIKSSTNHIIQLNQLSSSYQAKATLNLSEQILTEYIEENSEDLPRTGVIESSMGEVNITRVSPETYEAVLLNENGEQFSKTIRLAKPKDEPTKEIPENRNVDF